MTTFGVEGSQAGQFKQAIAVAVTKDGTVFAIDYGNNRIHKWRPRTP